MALETGMLHVTDADISMLESHFQQHKDLGNPVPVPYKGGGHNANRLHPMYRMMFLRDVHVTQTGLVSIFPKMIKTVVYALEIYNRDKFIHTQREISCEVMRKKDIENRDEKRNSKIKRCR